VELQRGHGHHHLLILACPFSPSSSIIDIKLRTVCTHKVVVVVVVVDDDDGDKMNE
jgi:hypothetical protein